MFAVEMKKRIFDKIQIMQDEGILGEILRLLNLATEEPEIYHLNHELKLAVSKARQQIKNDNFLTVEQAKKEIDEF
jgi:hypothetical protein